MEKIVRIIQTPLKEFAMSTYDLMIEKGKVIGRQEDASLQKRDFATSLIISTDFDDTKIASLVNVSEEYVKNLRKELKS